MSGKAPREKVVHVMLCGMPADPSASAEPPNGDKCPRCGSNIFSGYGLYGGGCGTYFECCNEGPKPCHWFFKMQDE